MKRFAERVAVVTGGARGLGAATVRRLAREGARVAVFDIDGEAAASFAASLGQEGLDAGAWKVDVTDRETVTKAMAEVHDRWGRLDILVNNAGNVRYNRFPEMTDDDWDVIIATHLRGAFICSQVAQRYMVEQRYGRIIMLSSIGALGEKGIASYSAAKAGLQGLARTLALELGPYNITVNCVGPGAIDTNMTRQMAAMTKLDFDEGMARRAAKTALKRNGRPEDVAGVVAFLASDDAAYVTGQVIYVAGSPVGIIA